MVVSITILLLLISSCSYGDDVAVRYLNKARQQEGIGHLKSALRLYEKSLLAGLEDKDPVIFHMANLYEGFSYNKKAIKLYESLLGNDGYFCKVVYKLAKLYYNEEQYLDSAVYYELLSSDCKEFKQKESLNLIDWVKALFFTKKYAKIVELLKNKLSDKFSTVDRQILLLYHGEALFELYRQNRATTQDKEKFLRKAIRVLEECINLSPDSREGLDCSFFITDMYVKANNTDKALSLLKKLYNTYGSKRLIKHKMDMLKKYY